MKITITARTPKSVLPYHLDTTEIIIGRSDPSHRVDVDVLDDRYVSRKHVWLTYSDGVWWAQDMASKRGTKCNRGGSSTATLEDVPVNGRLEIYPGDSLTIGETDVTIEYESDAIDSPQVRDLVHTLPPEQVIKSDDEFKPSSGMSETNFLELWTRFNDIVSYEFGESMLKSCVREIRNVFGSRITDVTILLRHDTELIAHAVYPVAARSATISYTLARRAIDANEAFSWPDPNVADPANVTRINGSAIYAPITTMGDVAGVLHIATRNADGFFTRHDIDQVLLIAKMLVPSIERDWNSDRFDPSNFPQVFVSYSSKDREFLQRFANDMRRRFIRVWFDERLETGRHWRENVVKAIEHAHVFLLLVSPQSVESENVDWEIQRAKHRGIPILPVEYKKAPLPLLIAELQYRVIGDTIGSERYEQGLRALIDEIRANARKGITGG